MTPTSTKEIKAGDIIIFKDIMGYYDAVAETDPYLFPENLSMLVVDVLVKWEPNSVRVGQRLVWLDTLQCWELLEG